MDHGTLKPGVELTSEITGDGPCVQKHAYYRVKLRMWLRQGEPVRWPEPWGLTDQAHVEEEGTILITDVRLDRVFLFAGLFYGMQGMRVGGTRTLRVAPHLAYRAQGVPGVIPPNALLTVQITVLAERPTVAGSSTPPLGSA
jgi:hypothetical protein